MLATSLKLKVVLLTVVLVFVAQAAVFGLMSIYQGNQRELDARAALNVAERLVGARISQIREQGWVNVIQVARDPILNRAGVTGSSAPTTDTLRSLLKRSQASRMLIVDPSGDIIHDVAWDQKIGSRDMPAFRSSLYSGKASGFLVRPDGLYLWVAAAAAFGSETSPAVVLQFALNEQLRADLATLPGVVVQTGVSSRLKTANAAPGQLMLSRRIFLSDAANNTLAVDLALQVPRKLGVALQNLDMPLYVVLAFAALLSAFTGFVAMKFWLRPLDALQASVKSLLTGDFKPMPRTRRKDEVSVLMQTFNLLVESVQQRERKILQTAYRDNLTALPNRTLYQERLSEALQNAKLSHRELTMLLVDLDQFKDVNETLGHAAGDAFLCEIANRIKAVLRGADSLIRVHSDAANAPVATLARLGGDDFAVLLPGCDTEQGIRVAARLGDVINQPFDFEGQTIRLSSTIGIASYPNHADDAARLIQAVDLAMYEAKSRRLAAVAFDPKHERDREQYLALQGDLRRALEMNELHLVFQPKVSLNGDQRLMVEALIRWNHPERGLQNPATFIPFAEKTGFITTITRWVLDNAMRQANIWKQQGLNVQIAVNISPKDVAGDELPIYVVSRLRHYNLSADHITVEIAEKAIVQDSEATHHCLTILDRFGVKMSIDDFGTGYSSLGYLRVLPVQGIKIDREFVKAVNDDNCSRVIVKSTVDLAHSLNIKITAEGVEDAETMATLRNLGCDFAQGYYFGKPLMADEYVDWVEHQQRRFSNSPDQRDVLEDITLPAPG